MLYPGGVAFGAYLKFAGLLSFGNLGVKRRPFGARLAALKTETDLLARAAAVARLGVDCHTAGVGYESSRPLTGAATKRGPAWPKINTQPPSTRPIAAPRDLLWPTRKGSHMLLAFVLGRP